MDDIPFWAYSPSPMTLATYTVLALYGAYKLESKTWRHWLHNFCEAALVIGLIILPYDSGWCLFQWLKFGHLYSSEIRMVYGILIRNGALYSLCLLSAWKLNLKTNQLNLKKSLFFIFPIMIQLVTHLLCPDPGWSDWTYGIRFPMLTTAPWLLSYLMVIPIRLMKWMTYVGMWKKNFIVGEGNS